MVQKIFFAPTNLLDPKYSLIPIVLFNQLWTELDTAQSKLTFPYLVSPPNIFLYKSPLTEFLLICPVPTVTGFNNVYLTMIRYKGIQLLQPFLVAYATLEIAHVTK